MARPRLDRRPHRPPDGGRAGPRGHRRLRALRAFPVPGRSARPSRRGSAVVRSPLPRGPAPRGRPVAAAAVGAAARPLRAAGGRPADPRARLYRGRRRHSEAAPRRAPRGRGVPHPPPAHRGRRAVGEPRARPPRPRPPVVRGPPGAERPRAAGRAHRLRPRRCALRQGAPLPLAPRWTWPSATDLQHRVGSPARSAHDSSTAGHCTSAPDPRRPRAVGRPGPRRRRPPVLGHHFALEGPRTPGGPPSKVAGRWAGAERCDGEFLRARRGARLRRPRWDRMRPLRSSAPRSSGAAVFDARADRARSPRFSHLSCVDAERLAATSSTSLPGLGSGATGDVALRGHAAASAP